jgi:predicted histone-like DNA-binding protein
MSKILYEVYKNDIKDSESAMYGKWYARLKSIETLSLTRLAKHIAEHGSVFTEDVVEGVLKKFKTCLIEMLLDSKKVKIDGLGIFYTTLENQKGGAESQETFSVNSNLKALHIRFLPEQAQEQNISSREFFKKAEFINIDTLKGGGSSAGSGTEENGSGTENGGGSSSGGSGIVPGPSGNDQPSGN